MKAHSESEEVQIPSGKEAINGSLQIPQDAEGIVVFAHGSGSSRYSVRNRFVAELLNAGDVATLLFDLLTAEEEDEDAEDLSLEGAEEVVAGREAANARGFDGESPCAGEIGDALHFGDSTAAAGVGLHDVQGAGANQFAKALQAELERLRPAILRLPLVAELHRPAGARAGSPLRAMPA